MVDEARMCTLLLFGDRHVLVDLEYQTSEVVLTLKLSGARTLGLKKSELAPQGKEPEAARGATSMA